jgi:hypothetical protein
MMYIYVCESMIVKSVLADIWDCETDFHGGKRTLRLVLLHRFRLWEILCCEGTLDN